MKTFARTLLVISALVSFAVPCAFANAASVSVQSLTPGSSVFAKDSLTFTISVSGITSPFFKFSDSFPNSSAALSNISGAGNFNWVPLPSDVGLHVFTITASDYDGTSAVTTQSVTVNPPPSLSIQSVSPSSAVNPGTTVTFHLAPYGFTTPKYSISDSFSGTTVANSNIDSAGNFSWTPESSQNGDHTFSVYVSDAASGHSAVASQAIHVGGWPSLSVVGLSGNKILVGTTTTFYISSSNYTPSNFSVTDSFFGSSLSNNNISGIGLFSWMPSPSDIGVHTITVTGTVGSYGMSTTTKFTLTVYSPGTTPASVPAPTPTPQTTPAPTPTPAPTAPAATGTFTLALKLGSTGDEVTHLQNVLISLGYLSGTPSGYYGALTAAAVKKFQIAHGISALGTVGPGTRAALNALSASDSQTTTSTQTTSAPSAGDGYVFKNFMGFGEDSTDGPDVMELQKRLISLGFLSGDATGYFGTATQAAVSKFQTAKGIKATGYVGSQTRAALNQ